MGWQDAMQWGLILGAVGASVWANAKAQEWAEYFARKHRRQIEMRLALLEEIEITRSRKPRLHHEPGFDRKAV